MAISTQSRSLRSFFRSLHLRERVAYLNDALISCISEIAREIDSPAFGMLLLWRSIVAEEIVVFSFLIFAAGTLSEYCLTYCSVCLSAVRAFCLFPALSFSKADFAESSDIEIICITPC